MHSKHLECQKQQEIPDQMEEGNPYLQCSPSASGITVIRHTNNRPRIRTIPMEVNNFVPESCMSLQEKSVSKERCKPEIEQGKKKKNISMVFLEP